MDSPGKTEPQPTFAVAAWVFGRVLGLCLLATFVSKVGQVPGLIGTGGITPLQELLDSLSANHGSDAWWRAPSLFWLSGTDAALMVVTWAGLVASACLTVGVAPRLASVVCYAVYLSFRSVDEVPLRWFNWPFDELLTEAAFVAIWMSPRGWLVWPSRLPEPPTWCRWLLLWMVFRLMLGTGLTKVLAGGSWLELDALRDFLLTQPQPTLFAMWCRELPPWLLQAAAGYTVLYELVAPWLFFWPGRVRRLAALCGVPLMIGIYLAGNFRGLNLLTLALLLMMWDDRACLRWWPAALRERVKVVALPAWTLPRRLLAGSVLTLVALASLEPAYTMFGGATEQLPAAAARQAVRPLHLSAYYYMFCSVPAQRFHLVLQGSADGREWRDYEPRGVPGPVARNPQRTAPFHEFLAFPMWLGGYGPAVISQSWLPALLDRLRSGSPDVVALFDNDPFPGGPPRFVRAVRHRYTIAASAERDHGTFWHRAELEVLLSVGE